MPSVFVLEGHRGFGDDYAESTTLLGASLADAGTWFREKGPLLAAGMALGVGVGWFAFKKKWTLSGCGVGRSAYRRRGRRRR